MKTKIILALVILGIALACEKEVNMFFDFEIEPVVIRDTVFVYQQDTFRYEFYEVDYQTENCKNGEYRYIIYKNSEIFLQWFSCRDCPTTWDLVKFEEEGVCDTFYVYDCTGEAVDKEPLCSNEVNIHHFEQCEDFGEGSTQDYEFAFDRPSNLDYLDFYYGSKKPYKIQIIAEDVGGLEHLVKEIDYPGNDNFDKYNLNCYDFISIKPEDYEYNGKMTRFYIYGIGLPEETTLKCGDNEFENNRLNIDNICWGWSWKEGEE